MDFYSNKSITRRKFVKGVTGVAVCCTCFPMSGLAISAESSAHDIKTGKDKEHLVAICGTYCGACPAYLAKNSEDEKIRNELQKKFSSGPMKMNLDNFLCDGCLSDGQIAVHCQVCDMRKCAASKTDVTRCSDCSDFPCKRITDFNNDGRLHHAELVGNLREIREIGVQKWVKNEEELWRCPQCRLPMSWYDTKCARCGEPRSERLFHMPKDMVPPF